MNVKPSWLLGIVALLLLYVLSGVLLPFLAAGALAYLFAPWVNRFVALRFPRAMAVTIVLISVVSIFTLVLLLIVPLLQHETGLIAERIPAAIGWLEQTMLPKLSQWLGSQIVWDLDYLKQQASAQIPAMKDAALSILGTVSHSGLALIASIAKLVLIPVILFYLLLDWPEIVTRASTLIPRPYLPKMSAIAAECDEVLASFVRGQMAVMLCLAIYYSAGLWLAGLDVALAVGLLTGLLCFVPYLGFSLGLLLGMLSGLLQFGDVKSLIGIAAVFVGGQVLEGMVLQPLLLGNRIGLHPVAVIFAILAGGELFGFTGVLLALPTAAVVVVVLRHGKVRYEQSRFYRGDERDHAALVVNEPATDKQNAAKSQTAVTQTASEEK